MARVLLYERPVDAVLTATSSCGTEIQNGMKIKDEPVDTTLNTDTTDTVVKNFFHLENDTLNNCSDIHHDEASLPEDDIFPNTINNKKNELVNDHFAYTDKTFKLKRKRSIVETEQVCNVSSQFKKKQKHPNNFQISKNENINASMKTIKNLEEKREQRSITDSKTKNQRRLSRRNASKNQYRLSKKNTSVECNICFREFSTSRICKSHKLCYIGKYQCKNCKRYMTRKKLYSHTKDCHMTYKDYHRSSRKYCHFCNCAFKDKAHVQSHLFHMHSKLIYSGNIIKHKNPKSKSGNISCKKDTLKIDTHKESTCLSNLTKSKTRNITLINNNNNNSNNNNTSRNDDNTTKIENLKTEESFNDEMSPTKKLRQPTLTEYLDLCKRKRDNNVNLNKFNITKDSFSSALFYGKVAQHFKQEFSEIHNQQVGSSSTKSNVEQTAHSTYVPDENQVIKPFVRIHADVEVMKSFLENIPDMVEDKVIKDQKNDINHELNHEVPYSLRSLKATPSVKTFSTSRKGSNEEASKKSQLNTEDSTRVEHNVTNLDKIDFSFWKPIMDHFKCKDCRVILTRCDKKSRKCHQIPALKTTQCNSTSFQENDMRKKMLKNLEVSLERLTTVPSVSHAETKTLDIEKRNSSFLCKVCKESFSSQLEKYMHIKSTHIAYMSSVCDARYKRKHKLLQHYLSEHQSKQNQCCICYTILSNPLELRRHLIVHCLKYVQRENDRYPIDIEIKCSLKKNNWKCPFCGITFLTQSNLMIHKSVCALQEEMIEDQKDSTKEINETIPKIIPKVEERKNAIDTVMHNEKTCSDECSNGKDSVEMTNKHYISLITEEDAEVTEQNPKVKEEPIINEDKEKSVNNNLVTKKSRSILKNLLNPEKLLQNVNSTLNNQNTANVQPKQKSTYPCNICGKQFQNLKNLQHHLRTFNYITDACPICNTAFSSKRLLQSHITAAHVPQFSKKYNFHCVFCNQGFIKKHELRPHILHLHAQQILNTFTHDSHTSEKKSATQTAMCNVCNLVFKTHELYMDHKMYYYKNHTFTCSLCAKNFQGMYMWDHHNKLTHYSEDKRKSYNYICGTCNEGFNHESHFHSHNMHVHLSEEADIAKESEERSRFDHVSKIQEQIRSCFAKQQKEVEQSPPSKYACQICYYKFKDTDDMVNHTALYSNVGNFRCDMCEKQCKTPDLLYQHRSLTHIFRDGYACDVCGEVLETVISLVCHKKHFHSNDIVCDNIDARKNCERLLSLNTTSKVINPLTFNNLTQNTANDGYNCLVCNMKFLSVDAIQTHIICTHMDDLFARRTASRHKLSIIENDNVEKQSVQQLIETDQASTSATTLTSTLATRPSATATITSTSAAVIKTSTLAVATTTVTLAVATTTVTSAPAITISTSATATTSTSTVATSAAKVTFEDSYTQFLQDKTSNNILDKNEIIDNDIKDNLDKNEIKDAVATTAVTSVPEITISTSATATTTSTSTVATSAAKVTFEDSYTQFLQDKTSNNNLDKNEIKDKSNIELLDQTKTILKNNKIVQEIPAASSNKFRIRPKWDLNIGTCQVNVLKNQPNANNPKINTSVFLPTESTADSKKGCNNSLKSKSISEFKSNLILLSNNTANNLKVPVIQSTGSTEPFKIVVQQTSKNGEITNQKSKNIYNCNSSYTCPLCLLEYPSLMFFHAHLKYAHANSILDGGPRMIYPQIINPQLIQKVTLIKCLLCLCVFIDENRYKSHLKISHTRYIPVSGSKNVEKTYVKKTSSTPEIITLDDVDNDKTSLDQHAIEAAAILADEKHNEKVGKLRVKPFAKIMENLSMERMSKHL